MKRATHYNVFYPPYFDILRLQRATFLFFTVVSGHAERQGDFCEFCGFCVQKYLTQTTQTGADFTPHGERRSTSPFCVFCGVCVRHFTACNILENTNLTNCTNHHADRDLLIAYKLHESMRGDNANVETSYYGVS